MISMNNTKIRLKIKTIDSNVTTIETSSTSTVLSLKESIRSAINIPVTNQKLIYQGKVLKDNDKLIDYKIEDNVVIHLVKVERHSEISNSIRNAETSTNNDNNSILTYLSLLSMLNSNNSFSLLNILTNRNQSQSNIDISDAFSHLSSPETFDLYSSYENICQNINNIKIILSNTNKSNDRIFTVSNSIHNMKIIFQLGQWVDVLDQFMQWTEGQIVSINDSSKALIHFIGHSTNLDEWIALDSPRIAIHRTHTIQSPFNCFYSPYPNKSDRAYSLSLGRVDDPIGKINDIDNLLEELMMKIKRVIVMRGEMKKINFEEKKKKEKEFYIQLMNLSPVMDRVARIAVDYAMMISRLSFNYFIDNYNLFEDDIKRVNEHRRSMQLSDNDERDILRQKVQNFEKMTQLIPMRSNGEIAHAYHFTNSQNPSTFQVRNQRGANFQQQLRNESPVSSYTVSNRRNDNGIRIDYLNALTITPQRVLKFEKKKTNIIHNEQFSIFHYNKRHIRTFDNFTQTYSLSQVLSVKRVDEISFVPIRKNVMQSMNQKNTMRSSKIVIDAKIQTKKMNHILIKPKGKLKLLSG